MSKDLSSKHSDCFDIQTNDNDKIHNLNTINVERNITLSSGISCLL